jgi:iron complex outermembrane receptor protein
MPTPTTLRQALAPGLLLAAASAAAQTAPTPPSPAASAPPAAATPRPVPAAAAASAPANAQRIEVTGTRGSDTDQRRQSTAAKIVVGREELDKFGDANVGEVLRRLPGVTTPGAPGRGGPPRMRGLGGGYTRLLIDGQPIPPGFSLDSLTPEQVERIEILRAPTAETGAQAIAGTINIITREGFQRRLNDLRIGTGVEDGRPSGGVFWSHNDNIDKLTYTLSAGLFANKRGTETLSETQVTDAATGTLLEDRRSRSESRGDNLGLNLNARLQWRLGAAGDSLVVMPGLFANRGESGYHFSTDERLRRAGTPEYAAYGTGSNENSFFGPRLMLQYRQRVGEWRLEGGGQARASRSTADSTRDERRADNSALRSQVDQTRSREKGLQLNLKGSRLLGGEGSEHSLVTGGEIEGTQRQDTRTTVESGVPTLTDFGENFEASTLRSALWAQDEWSLNQHWAFHAGLRWEGIHTRGDAGQGERPSNRNSVTTPLLHLLWKPDPKTRDQVRLSLTRSWRAPNTGTLIGRPNVNRLYDPALGSNTETSPDSAGNPLLKPELATGIDLAFERYLQGGGLLSANLFSRRIRDLMRAETQLEDVPWSSFDRWVRRTRNIGNASTQGLELEAKFRLDQVFEGTPPVELRANVALFRSKVDGVPGPDNRLDQQSKATANLGADYRMRGTPLTLGGNLNWVPGTTTRLAADQTSTTSTKRQWDMFVLWTFSPTVGLRVMGNNLLPRDYNTETFNDSAGLVAGTTDRTRNLSGGPNYINWQMRLELKL